MPLSPEAELLVSCTRTALTPGGIDRIRALAAASIDWPHLRDSARRHGVTPLLYANLQAVCPEVVPEADLANFREYFRENRQRNLRLTQELLNLLDLFHTRGIVAVPFKGPTLALSAYGDLGLREFYDLDLLVRPQDALAARDLLLSRGYRPEYVLDSWQQAAHVQFQYEFALVSEGGDVPVEIQWRIGPRFFSFDLDADELWPRLQPIRLGGQQILAVAPECLLLILCAHGAKHFWRRLGWICDVAEMLRSHPNLDWESMQTLAARLGVSRMLYLGLFLAHDLLKAPLPGLVTQALRADSAIPPLADRVRARLFEPSPAPFGLLAASMEHVRMRERLGDRVRYWVRLFSGPNVGDWMWISLPPSLTFLYCVLRPIRRLLAKRA